MHLGECLELRTPRGAAVVVEDLADHAGGIHAGKPREIDGRLRVADALEHAAVASAQRMNVSTATQVRRHRGRIDERANRRRAILRADTGGDPEPRRRIHAHRVRRAVLVEVALGHGRQVELIDPFSRQRDADHPARIPEHEVHDRRRDELRGADEVSFVLAILIVGDDDELSRRDVGDGLFDCIE